MLSAGSKNRISSQTRSREYSLKDFALARTALPKRSECLDKGPQLDLEAPGAAMLAMDGEISLGDRIGRQLAVRPLGLLPNRLDLAVDDEMRDMDVLGPEFARHGLG